MCVCVCCVCVCVCVFPQYLQHVGVIVSFLVFIGLIAGQAAFLASDWWLALWSRSTNQEDLT